MLEENKAQLEMELAREKKKISKQYIDQVRKHADQKRSYEQSPKSPQTPPPLQPQNFTTARNSGSAGVVGGSGGMFSMGGKSKQAIRVAPAFSQTKISKQNSGSAAPGINSPPPVIHAQPQENSNVLLGLKSLQSSESQQPHQI